MIYVEVYGWHGLGYKKEPDAAVMRALPYTLIPGTPCVPLASVLDDVSNARGVNFPCCFTPSRESTSCFQLSQTHAMPLPRSVAPKQNGSKCSRHSWGTQSHGLCPPSKSPLQSSIRSRMARAATAAAPLLLMLQAVLPLLMAMPAPAAVASAWKRQQLPTAWQRRLFLSAAPPPRRRRPPSRPLKVLSTPAPLWRMQLPLVLAGTWEMAQAQVAAAHCPRP